jgi:hypothetical protein
MEFNQMFELIKGGATLKGTGKSSINNSTEKDKSAIRLPNQTISNSKNLEKIKHENSLNKVLARAKNLDW